MAKKNVIVSEPLRILVELLQRVGHHSDACEIWTGRDECSCSYSKEFEYTAAIQSQLTAQAEEIERLRADGLRMDFLDRPWCVVHVFPNFEWLSERTETRPDYGNTKSQLSLREEIDLELERRKAREAKEGARDERRNVDSI